MRNLLSDDLYHAINKINATITQPSAKKSGPIWPDQADVPVPTALAVKVSPKCVGMRWGI